jgi:uncharacterized protein
VSDQRAPEPYGDPNTYAFWDAARSGRLLIQRCTACGAHQFYPRPFCLRCQGTVEWTESAGRGVVYAQTLVHVETPGGPKPPYTVAVVELDEVPAPDDAPRRVDRADRRARAARVARPTGRPAAAVRVPSR